MKLRIKGALFHCGRCGKSYSNPFGHVCVTRLDRAPRTGRARLALKVTVSAGKCPKCHRAMGNPLPHTCTTRTDFRKRLAAQKKADAAARRKARPAHLYEACQDADCQRLACRAWKEGRQEGDREGYERGDEDGHRRGYREGYDRGFPDGIAACPRKHG